MTWQRAGLVPPDLSSELTSDEHLLWSGKPRTGIRLQAVDAFLIPFALIWLGLVGVAVYVMRAVGAPPFMQMFPVPFASVGLFLLLARFLVDVRRAKTSYAVTDQRILIVREGRTRTVQSTSLRNLPDVTLEEGKDGYGSIWFGPPYPYQVTGNLNRPAFAAMQPLGFELIEGAGEVYRIIQEAKAGLSR
jgi:hypothetical protein